MTHRLLLRALGAKPVPDPVNDGPFRLLVFLGLPLHVQRCTCLVIISPLIHLTNQIRLQGSDKKSGNSEACTRVAQSKQGNGQELAYSVEVQICVLIIGPTVTHKFYFFTCFTFSQKVWFLSFSR